jgi:site-specific DNA-methyltransferase (adenine-specific)
VTSARVVHSDCLAELRAMAARGEVVQVIVTDPPYELGFMSKNWDRTGIAFRVETWRAAYDVLPPGGYLLAFGGTRTYHRMVCAIEDAGFRINDCIMWLHGQGFPKNRLTQLKPAVEPIVVAQKPLAGMTVSACVQAHGTGALNIDACRVEGVPRTTHAEGNIQGTHPSPMDWGQATRHATPGASGRWPANLCHDGSASVLEAFAAFGERKSTIRNPATCGGAVENSIYGDIGARVYTGNTYADTGLPSRFYYSAKASKADRAGSTHPTVKPINLMRWLVRLVTPPGGTVLDCFAGSGTTLAAATLEGFASIGIEQSAEYVADINARLAALVVPEPTPDLFTAAVAAE